MSDLESCGKCGGQGSVRGIFHALECMDCNGIGWIGCGDRDAARFLARRLRSANARIDVLERELAKRGGPVGAERDYQPSPRDGVAGHFTGD